MEKLEKCGKLGKGIDFEDKDFDEVRSILRFEMNAMNSDRKRVHREYHFCYLVENQF